MSVETPTMIGGWRQLVTSIVDPAAGESVYRRSRRLGRDVTGAPGCWTPSGYHWRGRRWIRVAASGCQPPLAPPHARFDVHLCRHHGAVVRATPTSTARRAVAT